MNMTAREMFEELGIHYQYIQRSIKLKKAYKGKNYYFISIEEYNKLKGWD